MSRSTLARSALYSILSYGVLYVMPILTTPYVIHRVGLVPYGAWVALSTAAAWLARTDLGIAAALVREVAGLRARSDREGLRAVFGTWLAFDLAAGAVVVGAAVALGPYLLPRLLPGGADPREAAWLFSGLALQSALTPLMRHFYATLEGLQRFDLTARIAVGAALAWAAALVALLEAGQGLPGLVLAGTGAALLQVAALWALLRTAGHPALPARFRGAELRRLAGFGWKLESEQVLLQAFRSDRLLLSATGIAPQLLVFYQLGSAAADRLASATTLLSAGVLPAATELAARGETGRLRQLLVRGTKYHALAAFGLLGFAALFGEELLLLWMGVRMPEAVEILRWTAVGGFLAAAVACARGIGSALGRPGLAPLSTALGLGTALLLYMTLARRYDYRDLARCVSAGLALAAAAYMVGLRPVLGFRWREVVGNALLKPMVLALPLAAVYAAWRLALPPLAAGAGRGAALAVLVPSFAAAAALGGVLARLFRVLDDYDMDVLRSLGRRKAA
jgi:O-antigen/teichoic acid export membrane protein